METFLNSLETLRKQSKWADMVLLFEKRGKIKDVGYQLHLAFAFACFKASLHIPRAVSICEEIILKVGVKEDVRQSAIQNEALFLERLNCLKIVQLEPRLAPSFDAFNPYPFWRKKHLFVMVRTATWIDQQYHTRLLLLKVNTRFSIVKQNDVKVLTPVTRSEYKLGNTTGLEDVRVLGNQITATSFDYTQDEAQIVRGLLTGSTITDVTPLKTSSKACEKNWMPLLEPNKFIYKTSPFTVLSSNEIGNCQVTNRVHDTLFNCQGFRGNTNVLPWGEDNFICMVHQVNPEGKRIYMQRFLVFNKKYVVIHVSRAFYLIHKGIEFVTGIVEKGDNFIIGVGVDDVKAYLVVLEKKVVSRMLK